MNPVPTNSEFAMKHRHLEGSSQYSLAAIDDMIDRGGRADWHLLREAADADPAIKERIRHICEIRAKDPCDQKFHLWRAYAG